MSGAIGQVISFAARVRRAAFFMEGVSFHNFLILIAIIPTKPYFGRITMPSEVLTQLRALEQSGKYLFHGSGAAVETFEPRQAFNYKDGVQIPDGPPAIFTSPVLDCAIFRALFSKANFPHGSHSAWSWSGGSAITFKATKKSIDELRDDMQGYIYVFNRAGFAEKNLMDWVCYEPAVPVMTFTVTRLDFTPPIQEMDGN